MKRDISIESNLKCIERIQKNQKELIKILIDITSLKYKEFYITNNLISKREDPAINPMDLDLEDFSIKNTQLFTKRAKDLIKTINDDLEDLI